MGVVAGTMSGDREAFGQHLEVGHEGAGLTDEPGL